MKPFAIVSFIGLLIIGGIAFAYQIRPTSALSGADTIALDLNVTGNTSTSHGSIEDCAAMAVGGNLVVDVIVDAVPPFDENSFAGGLGGFGFNILYTTGGGAGSVSVTVRASPLAALDGKSILTNSADSSVTSFSNSVPDTDGNFKIAEADSGATYDSGQGRLYQVTFTSNGTAGTANLDLTDTDGGDGDGVPDLYDALTSPYPIANILDARIEIGGSCTAAKPTPGPTPPPTPTPTASPAATPTPTVAPTPTPTVAPTPTATPTGAPSSTPTGSPAPSPTPTAQSSSTPTPTPSPTAAPGSGTPTPSPTPAPTGGDTPTPTESGGPTPTDTGSPTPTPTETATPTDTPTPTETPEPSPTAAPTAVGNANCEGGIGNDDIAVLFLAIAGVVPLPCEANVDADCSGQTDMLDVFMLLLYLADLPPLPTPSGCTPVGA